MNDYRFLPRKVRMVETRRLRMRRLGSTAWRGYAPTALLICTVFLSLGVGPEPASATGPTAGRVQGFVRTISVKLSHGLTFDRYLRAWLPGGKPAPLVPGVEWASNGAIVACTARQIFEWDIAAATPRPVALPASGGVADGKYAGALRVDGRIAVVRFGQIAAAKRRRTEIQAVRASKTGEWLRFFRCLRRGAASGSVPIVAGGGSGRWLLVGCSPAKWGSEFMAYRVGKAGAPVAVGRASESTNALFAASGGGGFGWVSGGHYVHLALRLRHKWIRRRIHLFGPPLVFGALSTSARRLSVVGFGPPTMIGNRVSVIQISTSRPREERVLKIWGLGFTMQSPACAPVYSENGRWLAVATFHDGGSQILVISAKSLRVGGVVELGKEAPISLEFSPNNRKLAIECWYRMVVVGLPKHFPNLEYRELHEPSLDLNWEKPETIRVVSEHPREAGR